MKKFLFLGGIVLLAALAFGFYKLSRFDAAAVPYEVRMKDGRFEVRRYPKLAVARTAMSDRDDSFGRLFQFISGENARQEKIAMTTPVLFDGTPGEQKTMSFIMPARVQQNGAPQPRSAAVQLGERDATEIASVRFTSGMDAEAEARALAELRDWIRARGLESEGEPIVAYYDSPFIPALLRRNEVMLRIERGS